MAASGNRSEEAESMFRLISAAPRPRELTGAIDLINQFGLRAHHEYFCKKPLPASIAETPYLNNVVGETEIRKGEGMELEQLIQEPPVMDIGFRIHPFDLETLRQALELRENGSIQLSEADRGLLTISGKVKSEHRDKEKKHKKHKDKEKDKDREHKKHTHRHKDKDKEKDKDKKKDKSGSHENGDDKSKKHHKKKRKHDGNEEEGDSHKHKKRKHKNSKGEDAGLTKNGN
ncbi:mediator of RNA polymerase II transcription subunit 19a [Cryptomeria japonica]|uniref:mediator of RNA polymerase II transcription subunit 19a n=1 Tax=Cryptomeria japonica TaxID=3369 RepID=UPI0027DA9B21|nr:mediator of RNA polymerase II transcription subunit 19a [Cryptomeria japonica]